MEAFPPPRNTQVCGPEHSPLRSLRGCRLGASGGLCSSSSPAQVWVPQPGSDPSLGWSERSCFDWSPKALWRLTFPHHLSFQVLLSGLIGVVSWKRPLSLVVSRTRSLRRPDWDRGSGCRGKRGGGKGRALWPKGKAGLSGSAVGMSPEPVPLPRGALVGLPTTSLAVFFLFVPSGGPRTRTHHEHRHFNRCTCKRFIQTREHIRAPAYACGRSHTGGV